MIAKSTSDFQPLAGSRRRWLALLIGGATFWRRGGAAWAAETLPDDRQLRVHSARDVARKRRELNAYIWGRSGFPSRRLPNQITRDIAAPVRQLTHLSRVDELRVILAQDLEGLAYHFIPSRPNGGAVVVHHGHACTLDDDPSPRDVGYGLQRTIQALLLRGYGVLGVFMPRMRPGDCRGDHEALFALTTEGNPMKFFLETTVASLNYLARSFRADAFPRYRGFHMTGLSGGGWTTTLYAALDPRIRCSVPVAGTLPFYLRAGGSVGDREQWDAAFYARVSYLDLHVMGAHGRGRRQVQVLVRRDDCCFGQAQHDVTRAGRPYETALREYEARVQGALRSAGAGDFRLEIDETAPSHMISHHAIDLLVSTLEP